MRTTRGSSSASSARRLVGAGLVASGALVMGAGALLLVLDVPAWNTLFFVFAWLGWLLVLDGALHALEGTSFLLTRPRELAAMMFWSVPYWCIFEAYNLVLENWYYVFVPRSEIAQGLFAFVAFSTVLPACFVHAELVRALGLFEAWRTPRLSITPALEIAIGLFGLAALVLPLIAPRWFFWIVWAATFGIPEVINRRMGWPSLIADLERGEPARWLRLLVGGMAAGLCWESLNYWARAKWIYVVPGFEEWKFFEMPLLGFVGFPALALEAFSAYSLLSGLVRGGRSWERSDAAQPRRAGRPALAWLLIAGFSALANEITLDPAVQSRRPLLGELSALSAGDVERLERAGVPTPEWLALARESGLPVRAIEDAYAHADLALHKGMGASAAALLRSVGVESPAALVEVDSSALHQRLLERAGARGRSPRSVHGDDAPSLPQVRVWVRAARANGGERRR